MKVIGITGGIASGKSAVTDILRKHFDCIVIDADQLARQAVEIGTPGLKKIVETFGARILTETAELNRGKLGEIIANDEQARKKLNAIVHPEIKKLYNQQIAFYEKKGLTTVYYDCPLLFETNLDDHLDETILVVADQETRVKRIIERDQLNREQALKRINMQMSDAEKIARADIIIENNGSLEDLLIAVNGYFSNKNN